MAMYYKMKLGELIMRENPFGNPDGSRTKIVDLLSEFIDINNKNSVFNDNSTRVIVGAKGSGKTVYLRRMKANIENNASVYSYTTDIAQDLPPTSAIVKFSQFFSEKELTEHWMQLWHCAILRALISHILCAKELKDYLTSDTEEFLRKHMNYNVEMNIYSEAKSILYYYNTKNSLLNYLYSTEWDEIQNYLQKYVLNEYPPIYFFVDCIDEEYGHAPMYWLRCQKGLFYTVMRLLRNQVFGNRFHIIISIRDQVLSSVYRSEHGSRYINDSHITILKWNYNSVSYFLNEKIKNLSDDNFINSSSKNISTWLGLETVENKIRNIEEPIQQYLLRHTRMIPRDIIILGNMLAQQKLENGENFNSYSIRGIVSKASTIFGNELLTLCANQILNDDMPNYAGRKNFSDVYTSIQEYNHLIRDELKSILLKLPSDRFSWEDIKNIKKFIKDKASNDWNISLDKIFDVLWQNGGVGYINNGPNGEEIFFVDNDYNDFLLPQEKEIYVLYQKFQLIKSIH